MYKKINKKALALVAMMLTVGGASVGVNVAQAKNWTIPELLENKLKRDQEADALCADKTAEEHMDCDKDYYADLAKSSELDQLTKIMNWNPFMVTAINPVKQTMRVVYNDRNYTYGTRLEEYGLRFPLQKLKITWEFDEEDGQLEYEDIAAIKPNQEIEIQLGSPETLGKKMSDEFEVEVKAPAMKTISVRDYRNCLGDPTYQEGMECKMFFPESGFEYYAPVWPDGEGPIESGGDEEDSHEPGSEGPSGPELGLEPEPMPGTDNLLGSTDSMNSGPTTTTQPENQNNTNGAFDGVNNNILNQSNLMDANISQNNQTNDNANTKALPAAPNTGKMSEGDSTMGKALVQWNLGLVILNLVVFGRSWYKNRKNSQNLGEISEKVLTKPNKCDKMGTV